MQHFNAFKHLKKGKLIHFLKKYIGITVIKRIFWYEFM